MILEQFIEANNLKFTEGERNTNCTILSGFAIYKNIPLEECKEVLAKDYPTDSELQTELERVYNFAVSKNYGKWWETDLAKSKFTF